MSTSTRTFRIFVSSTFADLKAERDALATRVFPRLRELCQQHGARFQAVDLRWGVSSEASLDQKTMLICLEELRRSQRISPRPNFVVLLGDRYGWRPLPYAIPGDEFAEIERRCPGRYVALLREWYPRDDNAAIERDGRVFAEHVLREREREYEDDARWGEVEHDLTAALRDATAGMALSPEARLHYGASATEQEIAHGALAIPDARDHVFCYFRRIANFDALRADAPGSEQARPYGDFDRAGALDEDARACGLDLKGRLSDALARNAREHEARWEDGRLTSDHIDRLCGEVYADLERVILAEIARLAAATTVEGEQDAHEAFGRERAGTFVGREEVLGTIGRYLAGTTTHPLVLYGPSGSGKSTVMARAAVVAGGGARVLIQRFVGTTPQSSDGRSLLHSLCAQIASAYDSAEPIPDEYDKLANGFAQRLSVATAERPLVLSIDALDQLAENDPALRLFWLPSVLPPHVRLVLSILSDVPPPQVASRLPAEALVRLEPMPPAQGSVLLDLWLAGAHRTLQPPQRREVLDAFAANGLPLYLKVAFEEARCWRSFTLAGQTVLGDDVPGVIRDLLGRLEKDHGPTLVERSLTLLGASRAGLSEDEMLDVLSAEPDVIAEFRARSAKSPDLGPHPRLPVIVWSRLFTDLEPYLSERAAEGATVMSFYHRQLVAAVDARYLASKDVRLARHRALAAYFRGIAIEEDGEFPKWRRDRPRGLSELPYHEMKGEQWEALEKTLTDIAFVEAKSRTGMVYDLLRDYASAEWASAGKPEREARQSIDEYLRKLIEYSEAHSGHWRGRASKIPPLPDPPGSMARCSEEESDNTVTRTWSVAERLRAWHAVVKDRGTAIASGEESAFQSAYNSADGGPVVEVAEKALVANGNSGRPWLRLLNRPPFVLEPACLGVLTGHTDRVTAVSLTADGKRALSGSWDGTLRMWNLETGESRLLVGHAGPVSAIDMTPDGRRAVSGGQDGTFRIWDLEAGQSLGLIGHTEAIRAVSITADGRRAISGGDRYVVSSEDSAMLRVWNLETGEHPALTANPGLPIEGVSMTSDGKRAVVGISDRVHVWDLDTGENRVLEQFTCPVNAVAVTQDGRWCIFAMLPWGSLGGSRLGVWNLTTGGGRCFNQGEWNAIAITPNGECAAMDGGWRGGKIGALAITADGTCAVLGEEDGQLRVCNLATGQSRVLEGHSDDICAVAMTPDGRRAVSGGRDKTVRWWDLERGHNVPIGELGGSWVAANGRHAVSRGGMKKWNMTVWDAVTGACRSLEPTLSERRDVHATGEMTNVELSPDGRCVFSWHRDSTVRVWDLATGLSRNIATSDDAYCTRAEVTPDARRAFSMCLWNESLLSMWNLETGQVRYLRRQKVGADAIAMTPDGRGALSLSNANDLHLWDLKRGVSRAFYRSCDNHWSSSHSQCVAILPDGKSAVSEGQDEMLCVWNLQTGQSRALEGRVVGTQGIWITVDGRRAVAQGGDGLRCWDLRTGHNECLKGRYAGVGMSPGGKRMVFAQGNALGVWDLEAGDVTFPISGSGAGGFHSQRFPLVGAAMNWGRRFGLLRFENLRAEEPRCVTGGRLWLWGKRFASGRWDERFTAKCEYCAERFSVPATIIDAIRWIARNNGLTARDSACLKLPTDAWGEPALSSECPNCQRSLRFNPFLFDSKRPWWKLPAFSSCAGLCSGWSQHTKSRRAAEGWPRACRAIGGAVSRFWRWAR